MCNQEVGAVFGDKGLVCEENTVCTRSVIANKPCMCYALTRDDFNRCCGVAWEARMFDMLIDCIRRSTMFPIRSNFYEACIHWLSEVVTPEAIEPGDVICSEGDTSRRDMYFIRQGHAFMRGGDVPETKVVRLSEGDVFGESAMLFDTPRTESVIIGKECKKCSGLGSIGARKYNCNRCGRSGARTDGPLVVVYKLSEEDLQTFIQMPNTETGEEGGVLTLMRETVLRRVLKNQYPNVRMLNGGIVLVDGGVCAVSLEV